MVDRSAIRADTRENGGMDHTKAVVARLRELGQIGGVGDETDALLAELGFPRLETRLVAETIPEGTHMVTVDATFLGVLTVDYGDGTTWEAEAEPGPLEKAKRTVRVVSDGETIVEATATECATLDVTVE